MHTLHRIFEPTEHQAAKWAPSCAAWGNYLQTILGFPFAFHFHFWCWALCCSTNTQILLCILLWVPFVVKNECLSFRPMGSVEGKKVRSCILLAEIFTCDWDWGKTVQRVRWPNVTNTHRWISCSVACLMVPTDCAIQPTLKVYCKPVTWI